MKQLAMKQLVALSIASSLLGACAITDLEEEPEITNVAYKPQCDDWGCGMNSPYIDNFGFHSLSLNGGVGENGFQIWKFEKNGIEYDLHVTDGKITGTKAGSPPLVAFGTVGPGLVGARIHLLQNGVPSWEILIDDVGRVQSWAQQSGQTFLLETYRLKWSWPGLPDKKFLDLCPDSTTEGGMTAYHAVVFEGDVIDSRTKRVTGVDNNVFNIGCAGNTLAKMALMGHTEVASRLDFSTTTSERQTLLKMYSADYCGTGKAFTVGGQPLQYSDDKDWINSTGRATAEALWDEHGAICLNQPRVLANPIPASTHYFSDVETQLAAECKTRAHPTRPSACVGRTPLTDPFPYHLISTNKSLLIFPIP